MDYIWILYLFFAVALYATHRVSYKQGARDSLIDTVVMIETGGLTYSCVQDEDGLYDVNITIKEQYED